jgi:hypothetical protein
MTAHLPNRESYLEIGLVLLGGLLLGGLAIFLGGRLAGEGKRARGHAQPPPAEGRVSSERHQNIATVSTR